MVLNCHQVSTIDITNSENPNLIINSSPEFSTTHSTLYDWSSGGLPEVTTVLTAQLKFIELTAAVCYSMDESRVAVSVALVTCCILAIVPLCMWAMCYVGSFQTLSHCIDMQW